MLKLNYLYNLVNYYNLCHNLKAIAYEKNNENIIWKSTIKVTSIQKNENYFENDFKQNNDNKSNIYFIWRTHSEFCTQKKISFDSFEVILRNIIL